MQGAVAREGPVTNNSDARMWLGRRLRLALVSGAEDNLDVVARGDLRILVCVDLHHLHHEHSFPGTSRESAASKKPAIAHSARSPSFERSPRTTTTTWRVKHGR